MSTDRIQEAIERDVAAAEADDDTESDETEAPAEPEPAPAPEPPSEKELAALGKKIDRENDRHAKALQQLYGPMFADILPCPLCSTEGFVFPLAIEQRDPDQVAAVHAALGEHEQPDLQMLEGVRRCPKCDGWGQVATPSRNQENAVKGCLNCSTRGYVEHFDQPAQQGAPPPVAYIGNGAGTLQPVTGEVDAWMRPAGHPHYGIAPALVQ